MAFHSATDGSKLARLSAMKGAQSLLFDELGKILLVTRADTFEITRIETRTFSALKELNVRGSNGIDRLMPLPGEGVTLAIPADHDQRLLHVIDLASGNVEKAIELPSSVSNLV